MNLLLDLGNTRLKWAVMDAAEPCAAHATAWQDAPAIARLPTTWRQLGPIVGVVGACVATAARRQLVEGILHAAGCPPARWLHSPAEFGGVRNAYAHPAELGIDRFLALLVAWRAGCAPCVVAGCGSALTLDVLDAQGRHGGGLIAAGVGAMQAALHDVAPALPAGSARHDAVLANNTADAIGAGAWQVAAGGIERFVARQRARFGVPLGLVLTGGDAARLATLVAGPTTVCPDAVIHGLAAWVRDAG